MEIIKISDDVYPEALRNIFDPPEKLYCIGNLSLLNNICVAVVGSRKCTEYGKIVSYRIGEKLSKNGITVVSGLAAGIDVYSHRGAISTAQKNKENSAILTIAVMAGGLDKAYPASHRNIFKEIGENGLLISEKPPGYQAQKFDFPLRNRIISGLSQSVIIVEAATSSGSLITADLALSQGKNVYAVPGNINSPQSLGTNKLIKEGAQPLISINDILIDMNITPVTDNEILNKLSIDEKKVYTHINKKSEISYEELSLLTGFSMAKIKGILTVLEIKGLIITSMGKVFIAKI